MKITLFKLLLCISTGLQLFTAIKAHAAQTTIIKHTKASDNQPNGFWTRKTTWKSRWVKYWQPKYIYVPIWKKVWSPVIYNEWVPLPNKPTDWQKKKTSAGSTKIRVKEVHF